MPREIPALTGVRFFFAAMVVAFHGSFFLDSGGLTSAPWIYNLVHTGYLGVQFFFVLSGFILAHTYVDLSSAESRRSFWVARFARIYPVYLVGLACVLPFVVHWTFFASEPAANTATFVQSGLVQLALLQAWTAGTALPWNAPSWTLSIEAFFYALFPYLLVTMSRLRTRTLVAFALAAFGLSQVAAYAVGVSGLDDSGIRVATEPPPWGHWIHFFASVPLFRLPEFIVGIAAALIQARHAETLRPHGAWISGLSLATCVAIVALAAPDIPLLPLNNAGLSLPAAALFIGLAAGRGPLARFLSNRHVVRLGAASYAIYILHYPIALWLTRATNPFRERIEGYPVTQFLVYFCAVVVVSLWVYARIEEPARKAIRKAASRRSALEPCVPDAGTRPT